MESSSKTFGDHGAEEYQSGESGWTMYLGSSMNDDDDEEDDGHVDNHSHGMKKKKKKKKEVYVDDGYDGSDDSMASDASSGPSHQHQQQQQQQQPWDGDGEGGHGHGDDLGMAHKYQKEDKVKKQVKKKKNIKTGFEARNEQRDECLVDEKRSIVTVQSGNKATYKGQRK